MDYRKLGERGNNRALVRVRGCIYDGCTIYAVKSEKQNIDLGGWRKG